MDVPQKTKNRVTIWSGNPTAGHISRENSNSKRYVGNSLAIQWLRICASIAEGTVSTPGQGIKIPHAAWHSQEKKRERERQGN